MVRAKHITIDDSQVEDLGDLAGSEAVLEVTARVDALAIGAAGIPAQVATATAQANIATAINGGYIFATAAAGDAATPAGKPFIVMAAPGSAIFGTLYFQNGAGGASTGKTVTDGTAVDALRVMVGKTPAPGVMVGMADAAGNRTWIETDNVDGGPTDLSMLLLRRRTRLPETAAIPGVGFAIPDAAGNRTWLEFNTEDGGPSALAVSLIKKRLTTSTTLSIPCYGDSMTRGRWGYTGSWPDNLAALTGRNTINLGISGSLAAEICTRAGGVVPMVTFAGGQLPAATTSVSVTVAMPGPLTGTGQPNRTYDVTIRSVLCTLTYDTTNAVWTIARKVAGTALLINPTEPVPAIPAAPYQDQINILWAGRNDVPKSAAYVSIEAAITRFEKLGTPFLVLGVMNTGFETIGTSGYNDVLALDAQIRARAPRNYVNIRGRMIQEGLALAGITPTTPDTTAIANDTYPPSLQYTGDGLQLHLNQAGDTAAALIIQDELKQRGMIA